jgi:DNA-binding XRE family transcriptional regulator
MKIQGNFIKKLRIGNEPGIIKFTQVEMAETMGVSLPTYVKIEKGEVSPTIEQVLLLLKKFKFELSELNKIFIIK